jgi:hypothetical protein
MPANFKYDPSTQLCEIHISGVLSRADLSPGEAELSTHIDAGDRPRLLVLLENFGGWQKGDNWVDADFMFTRGDKLAKMAIVGAGDKQSEVKAFTGAGLRPTPVQFFAADELDAARAWLLE